MVGPGASKPCRRDFTWSRPLLVILKSTLPNNWQSHLERASHFSLSERVQRAPSVGGHRPSKQ